MLLQNDQWNKFFQNVYVYIYKVLEVNKYAV